MYSPTTCVKKAYVFSGTNMTKKGKKHILYRLDGKFTAGKEEMAMAPKTRLVVEENTIYEIDEDCLLRMQEMQEREKERTVLESLEETGKE